MIALRGFLGRYISFQKQCEPDERKFDEESRERYNLLGL